MIAERKNWHLMPQDADISVLEIIRDVLSPLNDFTDALSGEKQVTISCIQPVLWKIFSVLAVKDTDGSLASEMKQMIADDLKKRYIGSEIPMLLDCATYFDVRFKNTFVADSDCVKERLLNDIESMTSTPTTSEQAHDDQANEGPPLKRRKTGLTDLLVNIRQEKKQQQESDSTSSTASTSTSSSSMLQNEFLLYGHQLQEVAVNDDPLAWWRENESCFPLLAKLAKRYMSATSVACERVFSTSGGIVNAKRNRLTAENVEMLTFLARNL